MVNHRVHPERGHERLNGLWEMGVRNYPVLGSAEDSYISEFNEAMYFYQNAGILEWQVLQLRRFKPLVAVGHDLQGEYGNGGHKVNAYFLTEAVLAAADATQFSVSFDQYGAWDTPKVYLHLYPENEIILDVNAPMENDMLHHSPFQIAVDAYEWHKSQHRWSFQVYQGEMPLYDCRRFGLYRSLVGADTCNDIMENTEDIRIERGA